MPKPLSRTQFVTVRLPMPPEPAVAASAPMSPQSIGCGRPARLKNPVNVCHQCGDGTNATFTTTRKRNTTPSIVQAKYSSIRSIVPPNERMSTTATMSTGGNPGLGRLIGRAGHAPHPGAEQASPPRCRPAPASPVGRTRARVEPRPEPRPRLEPHDPAVDRFARIERVANGLEVEDDLQHDRNRRDQKNR